MGIIMNMMKQLVEEMKQVIIHVHPTMVEADVVVVHAIPDCTCLARRPQTLEVEDILEEMMPEEDIPNSGKMAAEASDICPLM